MEMKPKSTTAAMVAMAAATVIVSFFTGYTWLGILCFLASMMAVLSFMGGIVVWKPWYLEGIDTEEPETSTMAILAVAFEVIMIVAMLAQIGWPMLVFRILGLAMQLAASGKLKREITPNTEENSPEHEKRRKSDPRPR